MSWTDLTFTGSHILTASDMNRLQGNFSAMAAGAAEAPPIAVNSLVVSGVASLDTIRVESAYIDLDAARIVGGTFAVARIPTLPASLTTAGQFLSARIPNLDASKITAGTFNENRIPFEAPGPIGSTIPGTGKFSTVDVTSSPPGTPVANRIYKESICKAWINFDGTTITSSNDLTGVRDFFNVSGVVKEGTGQPSIYWDRDFADANYAVSFGFGSLAAVPARIYGELRIQNGGRITVKTLDVDAGTQEDVKVVCVMAMGNQT